MSARTSSRRAGAPWTGLEGLRLEDRQGLGLIVSRQRGPGQGGQRPGHLDDADRLGPGDEVGLDRQGLEHRRQAERDRAA
jgi:hypothetical protein